jgi:hypothetical protein
METRRGFIKKSAIAGAALCLPVIPATCKDTSRSDEWSLVSPPDRVRGKLLLSDSSCVNVFAKEVRPHDT